MCGAPPRSGTLAALVVGVGGVIRMFQLIQTRLLAAPAPVLTSRQSPPSAPLPSATVHRARGVFEICTFLRSFQVAVQRS